MYACTPHQMRAMDLRAVQEYGIPSLLLMENAGAAVARRVEALLAEAGAPRGPVLLLCGGGNNGGDGFVAARRLRNRGIPVTCLLAAARERVQGDARLNLELLERLGVPVESELATVLRRPSAVAVDALLGTGFRGEPRGPIAEAITALHAGDWPILAVDVPSGVNAETGAAGECSVWARETVTFGLPKVGLLQEPARSRAGRLIVAEISLPHPLLDQPGLVEWITSDEAQPFWCSRPRDAHKGTAGRLLVLAGSPGLTGAAALCAEAALRAGAGLVTLGVPASLNPILEGKLTEAMTLALPETPRGGLAPEALEQILTRAGRVGALAIGPGLGSDPATGELVLTLCGVSGVPLVVDADGLNFLLPSTRLAPHTVLTPHPGELARLLGTDVPAVQSNRLEVAREAARRFGCVVVLKGPGTIIASPEGRTAVNSSGGPALATGGSGDVLTGIIGASLARGLAPFEAAIAGVFLHGVAGDMAEAQFGAPGAIAGDLVRLLPEARRQLVAAELTLPYEKM